jgi:hypothetical protein
VILELVDLDEFEFNKNKFKKILGFVREPPPTHVKFVSHDNLNSHMENSLNPIFTS